MPHTDRPANQTSNAPGDRRGSARYPCEIPGSCQAILTGTQAEWPATILDISATGARMLVRRRFEAGTLLQINLADAEGDSQTVLARIVRVGDSVEDRWTIGCRFARPLHADEIQALCQPGALLLHAAAPTH